MGKAVVTGLIEDTAKEGLTEAARRTTGSVASLLEEVGKQCKEFTDANSDESERFRLKLKFVPVPSE